MISSLILHEEQLAGSYILRVQYIIALTTRTPAVTDVLGSGRNDGALRPGRRVGFRSLAPGGQTAFPGNILFL